MGTTGQQTSRHDRRPEVHRPWLTSLATRGAVEAALVTAMHHAAACGITPALDLTGMAIAILAAEVAVHAAGRLRR